MASPAALREGVRSFLAGRRMMLIAGKWMPAASGATTHIRNPATGEVIASVPESHAPDIDLAVTAARRAFDEDVWGRLGPSQRGKVLWKIADLIDANADELAELESLNNGMPFRDAKGFGIPRASDTFRYYAGWATKIHGRTSELGGGGQPSMLGYTLREPVGVVGMIVPWNAPLMIAAWKLAPALAAGCTCILKPAEETPLTALRLGEFALEAGVPPGVVNIVTGFGHTAGAAIAAHPGIDKVAFTGSSEVGRLIVAAAATNLKKVSLELGGKSPVVVFDDADLEKATIGAARAIFNNAGQVCTAGSRLYVQKKSYDKVVAGVAEVAKRLKVGDGMDPSTEMGPLISDKQLQRVIGYIRSGVEEGAEVVTGGHIIGDRGYFVAPTVLAKTTGDMAVVREEIFGPVLATMPFTEPSEIPALANSTRYGLAASVWTRDVVKAHSLARQLRAGSVGINLHSMAHSVMPFGGYKESGWGRENGPDGLEAYLETKSVLVAL